MKIFQKYILPALIVLGAVALDQITKVIALANLPYREEVVVIDNIFSLFLLNNTGMAFGLMQGQRWILIVITIIILPFLAFFYSSLPEHKKVGRAYRITILVLMGGALGNFIDRIFRETGVVDFFLITAFDGIFPWVFNVADIFVVVPIFVMATLTFFLKEEDLKKWKFRKNA
ncbi:MAG: signal peptidase II [Defluviitaleaceae bacterium]|nr:signal peptidase II [Defluviitaleaceae bacterium]